MCNSSGQVNRKQTDISCREILLNSHWLKQVSHRSLVCDWDPVFRYLSSSSCSFQLIRFQHVSSQQSKFEILKMSLETTVGGILFLSATISLVWSTAKLLDKQTTNRPEMAVNVWNNAWIIYDLYSIYSSRRNDNSK